MSLLSWLAFIWLICWNRSGDTQETSMLLLVILVFYHYLGSSTLSTIIRVNWGYDS